MPGSAFELMIDIGVLAHIKMCAEASTKVDWSITTSQLCSFLSTLGTRGAYESNAYSLST